MKYRVVIDPQAKEDMREIFYYVSINDSLEIANKLLVKIEETCYKLERLSERGHIPEELKTAATKKYLEIHCKPYRIIYEIKKDLIYIHSVLDGRRNVQEILSDRILR